MIEGRTLVFDTEGDGLFEDTTKLHCLGIIDPDTGEEFYYGPACPKGVYFHPDTGEDAWNEQIGNPAGTIEEGLKFLSTADHQVAHNGAGHDYLVCEKLYPGWERHPENAWDSLVLAKLIWPYDRLLGPDLKRAKSGGMPMHMVKRHSLEAWGYRLGEYKDGYAGDPRIKDPKERYARRWEEWNPWMASYMMQDVRPNVKLWHLIKKRAGWDPDNPPKDGFVWPLEPFRTECKVASILRLQEAVGCAFDMDKAEKLKSTLLNYEAQFNRELVDTFGSWWQPGAEVTPGADRAVALPEFPDVTIRRFSEKTGKELKPYVGPPKAHFATDAPYTPITHTVFSPASRDHLGQRLQAVFGWKPKKFGKNGKPTVDETVLEEIPEAVMPKALRKLVLNSFVVSKTLGMLARGANSWLKLVRDDGRMHGRIDSAGAISGRGLHSKPNVSQTPAVQMEKDPETGVETPLHGLEGKFGWECRELFCADEGWEQTGVDASSLELICLGHYLSKFDNGEFSERVSDPTRDAHQEHADLSTEVSGFPVKRKDAKTTIYLKVYGGSAFKLSLDPSIVVEESEVLDLLQYRGLPMMLSFLAKRFDQDFVDSLDDMQKARIVKARKIILALDQGITGLKDLIEAVKEAAAQRGYLRGLDGRKVYVRKPHAALNSLLQSAGAQAVKLWMVLFHEELAKRGVVWGRDYIQTMWNHDEFQIVHRPGLGPVIKEVANVTIKEAGRRLGLRGEFRSEGKTGHNWAECH